MSFGSRTPIEVAVSGPKFENSRAYAARVREQLKKIASLRDLQFVQAQDYPTVNVQVDREKAGQSGVTPRRRGQGDGGRHQLQPLRRAEFLGRSDDRRRLSGAGRNAARPHRFASRKSA